MEICSDVIKENFNKELVMAKRIINILRTQLNVGFVKMFIYVAGDVKVRDHCLMIR